ncbi:MAG: ExbD/TolR family protein [Bradymonadaceae bacterium]
MAGTDTTDPGRGRGQMIDGINVTPLVDIMLVLLIIVMVTARFASSSAMPLDLPQASESTSVQTIFAVTLPADGQMRVDGERVDPARLERRAARALDKKPDLRAVIQADGDVPHRRVMETMDALRAAGLTRVAFATTKETSDDSPQSEEPGRSDRRD